jgi:hypothetical protein
MARVRDRDHVNDLGSPARYVKLLRSRSIPGEDAGYFAVKATAAYGRGSLCEDQTLIGVKVGRGASDESHCVQMNNARTSGFRANYRRSGFSRDLGP